MYTSKIISSDRDLLSVVFYGTEENKNSADFKHIYVLQELDNPGKASKVMKFVEKDGVRKYSFQSLWKQRAIR